VEFLATAPGRQTRKPSITRHHDVQPKAARGESDQRFQPAMPRSPETGVPEAFSSMQEAKALSRHVSGSISASQDASCDGGVIVPKSRERGAEHQRR